MNLLEYCVFSATNRVDRKTKSLVFEDPVYCNIERQQVIRRLTVAFSAQYGRPTARDDLVLLAMLKKSRDEGFATQRVNFTRYELLRILGWPENGQNYERIDQALNRIIGTHLVWDNAFWDNKQKSWVDRKFSIIDDVHLYDREKFDRARKRLGEPRPKSWFKWSDVMFESFQAGYIKSIDFELLQSLNESVGKRLYRWLDKHFNNPKRRMPIEIPIAVLATQKLGFQSAPASHLQRMLAPAIEELEAISYLAPDSVRFLGSGKNCVARFRPVGKGKRKSELFSRKSQPADTSLRSPLARELAAQGVSKATANYLAKTHETESRRQLDHLEWLLDTGWKPDRGTGAWLTAAVKNKFTPPADFKSKAERERKRRAEERRRAEHAAKKQAREARLREAENERATRVANYLRSLPKNFRRELEERAVRSGDDFIQNRLAEFQRNGDQQMTAIYREKLIRDYVESLLSKKVTASN